MASDEPVAMDVSHNAQLRILILLDITGSMSGEIEAVKKASAELVRLSGEEFSDIQLAVAVITFTERDGHGKIDGSCCYVSLAEFTSLTEAQSYINNIKLSTPPDQPDVSACGDDEEENQKAALYRTVDLNPSVPTIAFLITDAGPHMSNDTSQTATHEWKWLQTRGLEPDVASDIFRTFAKVLEHFNGSLVLNVVSYNLTHDDAAQLIYGNFAQRTGGMLMTPISRSPAVLARGLTDVVRALLGQMSGQAAEVPELEGFSLMDVSGVNPDRLTERDAAGEIRAGDNQALFEIAMERMVAVAGAKLTKRAIGMTAPSEQLHFVWRAARYIYKASNPRAAAAAAEAEGSTPTELDAELAALLELRDSILNQLPEDQKGHFTISESDIQLLAEEAKSAAAAAAGGGGDDGGSVGSVSAISLETVGDALADDAVWEDWLAVVMRLLMGFPLSVQLPKDKFGNPDFMDCWSASMDKLGIDRTSAGEFMQLIGSKARARGLTDKGEYNAFLVLVEPSDQLASLVFRIASGTQVLNYVTGVLLGAPGFLPNMYAGIASAALLRLISRSKLSEFEWSQAQQIMHSLSTMHRNAARAVSAELKMGRANPADHPSKLLLGAIRLSPATSYVTFTAANTSSSSSSTDQQSLALRLMLQEWLASLFQRHYGKSSPESDAAYLASLLSYIPLELLGPAEVDPLQRLHPLEQTGVPDSLQPGYQEQILARLRSGSKGTEELPAHPVYVQFVRGAKRLIALLCKDSTTAAAAGVDVGSRAAAEAPASDSNTGTNIEALWPDWEQGLLQLLLLRWRTARYRNITAEPAAAAETATGAAAKAAAAAAAKVEVLWEPVEVDTVLDLLLKRLREAAAAQLQAYKKARAAAAADKLLAAAADVLLAHPHDAAAASAALQQLYVPLGAGLTVLDSSSRLDGTAKGPLAVILGQPVYLQRGDASRILEKCLGVQTSHGVAAAAAGSAKDRVTADMLDALVLGDWCTQGPQALRHASLVLQLCQEMGPGGVELLDAIRAVEKCARATGPNKNGHSSELQYPGPDGYTKEYVTKRRAGMEKKLEAQKASEAKRLRKEKKLKLYMESMYKFTEVAKWAKEVAAGDEVKLKGIRAAVAEFSDANQVAELIVKVEGVLGEQLVKQHRHRLNQVFDNQCWASGSRAGHMIE